MHRVFKHFLKLLRLANCYCKALSVGASCRMSGTQGFIYDHFGVGVFLFQNMGNHLFILVIDFYFRHHLADTNKFNIYRGRCIMPHLSRGKQMSLTHDLNSKFTAASVENIIDLRFV